MSMRSLLLLILLMGSVAVGYLYAQKDGSKPDPQSYAPAKGEEIATFAGGCFWCMEGPFEKLRGVRQVVAGYAGGKEKNPSYRDVASGKTGHSEAVRIVFDPKVISYAKLVEAYWRSFDPTDLLGQFADRGKTYRPVIFVHSKAQRVAAEASRAALNGAGIFDERILVPIEDFTTFYPAERYHQDYYKTNQAHYERYRRASGRAGFLERAWKKAPPLKIAKKSRYSRPSMQVLKKRLSEMQWRVTQEDGTEPPFKNEYWDNVRPGIYVDIVSGEALFSSKHKYKSGTGWPSFWRPLVPAHLIRKQEGSCFELRSKFADSHLGHVFEDSSSPSGKRYCINSAALRFIPAADLLQAGYEDYASAFAATKSPAAKAKAKGQAAPVARPSKASAGKRPLAKPATGK
ncbi:MAG: methionine sulfoxide reductase [Planctomycetota bacterium]|nr:MAG: methionine sulfoxide reductase [Planctomycetota bacterium]